MKNQKNSFEALLTPEGSGWKDKAQERKKNKEWRSLADKIAVTILKHLRDNSLTQVELAKRLDVTPQYVSKIVQGRENLTIENICKIQQALGVQLIEVPEYNSTINYQSEFHGISNYGSKRTVYSGSVELLSSDIDSSNVA